MVVKFKLRPNVVVLEVGPVKEGQGRVFQPGTTGRKRSWDGNELGTSVGKSGMRCDQIGRSG